MAHSWPATPDDIFPSATPRPPRASFSQEHTHGPPHAHAHAHAHASQTISLRSTQPHPLHHPHPADPSFAALPSMAHLLPAPRQQHYLQHPHPHQQHSQPYAHPQAYTPPTHHQPFQHAPPHQHQHPHPHPLALPAHEEMDDAEWDDDEPDGAFGGLPGGAGLGALGMGDVSPVTPSFAGGGGAAGTGGGRASKGKADERVVRRRSSKACDQCRKSKCKCERTPNSDACRACAMLGTQCTFLGPSRKRGPPKGYIDAIESRLHQTEALIGIILALAYPRAEPGGLNGRSNDSMTANANANTNANMGTGTGMGMGGMDGGSGSGSGSASPLGEQFFDVSPDPNSNPNHGPSAQPDTDDPNPHTPASTSTRPNARPPTHPPTHPHPPTHAHTHAHTRTYDPRARALVVQLAASDALARSIIERVDLSPYGTKGRRATDVAVSRLGAAKGAGAGGGGSIGGGGAGGGGGGGGGGGLIAGLGMEEELREVKEEGEDGVGPPVHHHPSNAWQDHVVARMQAARPADMKLDTSTSTSTTAAFPAPPTSAHPHSAHPLSARPSLSLIPPIPTSANPTASGPAPGPGAGPASTPATAEHDRRTRRRIDTDDAPALSPRLSPTLGQGQAQAQGQDLRFGAGQVDFRTPRDYPHPHPHYQYPHHALRHAHSQPGYSGPGLGSGSGSGLGLGLGAGAGAGFGGTGQGQGQGEWSDEDVEAEDDEVADAVGQLSLNEDAQVRYHGKASGLHLLQVGGRELPDGRNEGGIWRFPKARVWPPVVPSALSAVVTKSEDEFLQFLPPLEEQERFVELYFIYVHPVLPAIHKSAFLEDFKKWTALRNEGFASSPGAPCPLPSNNTDPRNRISPLLLFAMFALAARYASTPPSSVPPPPAMWTAGDTYLAHAKALLDSSYASSRTTTCQALVLMGYREIGIGAMAQAWLYVGMAVRMAQDLGLHKSADRWSRASVGGLLFNAVQQQERKRIWYAAVIMDKYVSTYIGRPLSIFERDYDTPLPNLDDMEEMQIWLEHPSVAVSEVGPGPEQRTAYTPVPGHVMSCFNESAVLSSILSAIVQALYAIRPPGGRVMEAKNLEEQLSKWYFGLPDHLRLDNQKALPPPHVLTLHMHYWTTVLLLHRPFIRDIIGSRRRMSASPDSIDGDPNIVQKNYDQCTKAANHITSIVSRYQEVFCIRRAPVFLSYYIFSAGIMHVTILTAHPDDPQARVGLDKCLDALHKINIIWPSAGRQWELLDGSRSTLQNRAPFMLFDHQERAKRTVDDVLHEDADAANGNIGEVALRNPIHLHDYQDLHGRGLAAGGGYTMPLELQAGAAPLAYGASTFDRWPDTSPSFSAALSTSVLPQQYSTGLVDYRTGSVAPDRAHSSAGASAGADAGVGMEPGSVGVAHGGGGPGRRAVPQFWSDYPAMGESPMMNMFNMNVTPLGAPGVGTDGSEHSPQYTMSDQFGVFKNFPSSGH